MSSSKPYQYPGVDLPLRHLRQKGRAGVDFYRCGSFEGANGTLSELIQVREVFMMVLMDRLTEKPNWHEKVFDEAIVAEWRREAVTQPEEDMYRATISSKTPHLPFMPVRVRFMTEKVFDYCIEELRCKAAHFKETGLIFTLDSPQVAKRHPANYNTIIKADSLVSGRLREALIAAFAQLRADQAANPDWHPGSNGMVQDLVHPSMYPFVYGKTKFLQEEVVGVTDAIDKWAGMGEVVPKPEGYSDSGPEEPRADRNDIARDYWSSTYQWLPANLVFQDDGTVRFTSYINNLHPKKHAEAYRLIEKLIDTAIPAWERVLSGRAVTASGDDQQRLEYPPGIDYDEDDDFFEPFDPEILAAVEAKRGPIDFDSEPEDLSDDEEEADMTDDEARFARKVQRLKWRQIRDPILMEPLDFEPVTYRVEQSLRERFKDTGLQVIVKMASIELTPEKPSFPAGGWHIEGMMNEHIVATALYYLDSENVTPTELSFRMATSSEQNDLEDQVAQHTFSLYEYLYGTTLGADAGGETIQPYGSVATPPGRLLVFPNVFQHRVSSFRLADPTKPGHRRFVALWLVDPLQRIISTANVPPQRLDWWAEAVFGSGDGAARGAMAPELFQVLLEQGAAGAVKPPQALLRGLHNRLPAEVMDMLRRHRAVPEGLMTDDEAREHRLALMAERSAFVANSEDREWTKSYGFCEH